jgi:signal recognition particle subunit SRP9
MYKTHSAIILNRFESLNLRLLSQMANVKRRAVLSPPTQSGQATPATPMTEDDPMGSPKKGGSSPRKGSPAPQAQPATGGGGGKKKKKKGKR